MHFRAQGVSNVTWTDVKRALAEECVTYEEAFGMLPQPSQKCIMVETIACAVHNSEISQQQQLPQEYQQQHRSTPGDGGHDAELNEYARAILDSVKRERNTNMPIVDLTHDIGDVGDDCADQLHEGDHGTTSEKHVAAAGKVLRARPGQRGRAHQESKQTVVASGLGKQAEATADNSSPNPSLNAISRLKTVICLRSARMVPMASADANSLARRAFSRPPRLVINMSIRKQAGIKSILNFIQVRPRWIEIYQAFGVLLRTGCDLGHKALSETDRLR